MYSDSCDHLARERQDSAPRDVVSPKLPRPQIDGMVPSIQQLPPQHRPLNVHPWAKSCHRHLCTCAHQLISMVEAYGWPQPADQADRHLHALCGIQKWTLRWCHSVLSAPSTPEAPSLVHGQSRVTNNAPWWTCRYRGTWPSGTLSLRRMRRMKTTSALSILRHWCCPARSCAHTPSVPGNLVA